MDFSDLPRKLSALWETDASHRNKAIQLLSKIFNKILSNPQQQKFGDLNFQKITAKFRNCRPAFYLLYEAGFKESIDGTRFIWSYNSENYNLLQKVKHALQEKLKEPNTAKATKKIDHKSEEWQGTKYRRQIQQKLKREESEQEKKRKLIKERIAMQRKEQQIEQKRLIQKIKEQKQRQKDETERFIKEQMMSGMNEIMHEMMRSLLPTNTEQKSDNDMHKMPKNYKPSHSSGVYGVYMVQNDVHIEPQSNDIHEMPTAYNPSHSSGIYGLYVVKHVQNMSYDETLVNKLCDLGIATRKQLIQASQLADDHQDEFCVIEALQSILE